MGKGTTFASIMLVLVTRFHDPAVNIKAKKTMETIERYNDKLKNHLPFIARMSGTSLKYPLKAKDDTSLKKSLDAFFQTDPSSLETTPGGH